jgi:hypothetical protein
VALKTGLIDTIQFKNVSSLTIENAAFSECTGIEQVDFSGYVSSNPVSLSINQYAFAECRQLKEINFSSPTGGGASTFSFSIGDYAFEGCEELTGFTKNSENTSIVLTNIGNAPFFKCGKLTFDGVNALASSLNTSKISNGTNGVAIVANT